MLKLRKQAALRIDVLNNRFDDKVCVRECRRGVGDPEARDHFVAVARAKSSLRYGPRQHISDEGSCIRCRTLLRIEGDHGRSHFQRPLTDAAPHCASADHAYRRLHARLFCSDLPVIHRPTL